MHGLPELALDCDGVMANFHAKVLAVLGLSPDEFEERYGLKVMWRELRDYHEGKLGFFETLDLMPDAMELFNAVKHVKPFILTGCPFGNWAPPQKERWGARLFPGTRVVTCSAREKIKHLRVPGTVLVDDKTKYQTVWEEGGGVFVHHTSAAESIARLKGVMPIWFQVTDWWTPPRS